MMEPMPITAPSAGGTTTRAATQAPSAGGATTRTVVVAPDSFKLTASAGEVADALADALDQLPGVAVDRCPMSDGGDGFVDVLSPMGGRWHRTAVAGPLGAPVEAAWRAVGDLAVVEAASACGLALVGGPEGNDPWLASTAGVGQLLAAVAASGARRVVLGVGGTATTDGGRGAVDALRAAGRAGWVRGRVTVACDVTTAYLDAADRFAAQKGASPGMVADLRRRLVASAVELRRRTGGDPAAPGLPGSGAGGGLAGALAALGADLVRGAPLVADLLGLGERLVGAAAVVTGEGCVDATSAEGKVVGEVLDRAAAKGVPVVVVAGSVAGAVTGSVAGALRRRALAAVVDLSAGCGPARAWSDPAGCIAELVPGVVADVLGRPPV